VSLLTDLQLNPKLFKALDKLGFVEATEVQAQAIPAALAGKDLMVSAKTGSGKTAAFVLPVLNKLLASNPPKTSTRALILLPTRELALQTQKMFEKLASFTPIKCGLVIGGEAFKHQVASIRKNPEVMIATPGRLVEHLEKGNLDFKDLEVLILDEADRMLDMGFAEDMNAIAAACNPNRQNLLFSATLSHQGFSHIKAILRRPESIVTDSHRQAHSQIQQQFVFADDAKHKERLITALVKEESASRVFVFCNTREQCQQLGSTLQNQGLKIGHIHGEIAQSIRKQVMSRFRDGKITILVATDVAARGLDIQDVELVINYTVAHSGDDHVHRVGRTGRAGSAGKAITLVSSLEFNQMSSIERYLKIRFEPRQVKGLEATYRGPKKLKKSGKAAGVKKSAKKKVAANAKKTPVKPAKQKHLKRKAAPPRPATAKPANVNSTDGSKKTIEEGFRPLRKRP
jgi:ATP-dependent RNA helicase SrmB